MDERSLPCFHEIRLPDMFRYFFIIFLDLTKWEKIQFLCHTREKIEFFKIIVLIIILLHNPCLGSFITKKTISFLVYLCILDPVGSHSLFSLPLPLLGRPGSVLSVLMRLVRIVCVLSWLNLYWFCTHYIHASRINTLLTLPGRLGKI